MRRQSRELALQILFQTEFSPQILLSELIHVFETTADKSTLDYTENLIQGVKTHKKEIDAAIQANSSHWKIDRMALVDRNILRLATFEMKWAAEPVKPNIVINEAVEIAKKYGTTESASFINGILDQVSKS
jgi:N utilization substance protein B